MAWVDHSWTAMKRHSSKGTYINYLSTNDAAAVKASYGQNLARLATKFRAKRVRAAAEVPIAEYNRACEKGKPSLSLRILENGCEGRIDANPSGVLQLDR